MGGAKPDFILSFPSWKLSPNGRKHRLALNADRNAQKLEALTAALQHRPIRDYKGNVGLRIDFFPPSSKNDLDNCLAAFKAGLDGLAKGLGINDKAFRPITIDIPSSDSKQPRVEVYLIPLEKSS